MALRVSVWDIRGEAGADVIWFYWVLVYAACEVLFDESWWGEDGYSVRAWEQVVTEWEFGRDAGAAGSAVVVVMINGNV